ncbi:MAG: PSD1 and planctomycete cytochrome C domain-containing protein, partial [Planctomycetota bacterium]
MTDCKPIAATLLAALLLPVAATAGEKKDAEGEAFFTQKVLPILEDRCMVCHAHEYEAAEGGLVLDSRAGWAVGGSSGPAVTPGKPAASLLYLAVSGGSKGLQMPPDDPLPAEEITVLKAWIEAGAADPRSGGKAGTTGIDIDAGREWWAFQPLPPSEPEALADWGEGAAADPFVEAKLQDAGLVPAGPAEPAALLRRLSYDLTGLPPDATLPDLSPADIATEAGYAAAVDRLLASPHFGERWGRHWLDLARYADSNGSSFNPPYRQAWRYRNWVVRAVNDDLPVDRFLAMQLAGDLLPWDEPAERDDNLIATGYWLLGSKVLGTFDKEQMTLDVADEQLDVFSKSMLGLTVACARCHDHKFDPVPQADYYALAGILTSTATLNGRLGGPKEDESDWSRRGLGPDGDAALEEFLDEHRHRWVKATQKVFFGTRQLAELEDSLADAGADEREALEKRLAKKRAEVDQWAATLEELEAVKPPHAMAVRDAAEPADEALRIRGVPASRGAVVPRGFLQVASSPDTARPALPDGVSGRRELAAWVTSEENPLTARVFVNRVWQRLMRRGLVRSVDNFGVMGETPSHPELLDVLARRFVDSGWRLKRL